ncbi:DUF4097 family beta strand repeat-containing protein [Bacillaceae bacterium W0354]
MNEKKRRILQMLEEGHITAEEAESLLETLEDQQGRNNNSEEKNQDEPKRTFQDSLKSFTEGIFHIIDDTVQKVKEGPFEFNFSHVNVKRNFDFSSDFVKYLNFDLQNGSVEILPSDDSFIHVEIKAKVFKETDQQIAEEIFDKYINVEVDDETLHFEQNKKHISLSTIVYLPRKDYKQAYIKTMNGSFTIRSSSINIARISSINGSIKLSDYEGEALYAETKHGSIRLDDIDVSKIKAETTTGSLYVDGKLEYLDGSVVTGSVRTYIKNVNAKRADLKTTTGSIQLSFPKELQVNGNANTNFGSIDINSPNMTINQLENQTIRKHFEFYNSKGESNYFDVDLSTKTGSIRVNTMS